MLSSNAFIFSISPFISMDTLVIACKYFSYIFASSSVYSLLDSYSAEDVIIVFVIRLVGILFIILSSLTKKPNYTNLVSAIW
nr:MAG TPA: hypothetical protein [Caudoviricetes sp.]